MLEGYGTGLPEIREVMLDKASVTFVINGLLRYRSPLGYSELSELARAIDRNPRVGVGLRRGEEPDLLGGLSPETTLSTRLLLADVFIGAVVFGRDGFLDFYKIPGDFRPRSDSSRTGAHLQFNSFTHLGFTVDADEIESLGIQHLFALVPVSSRGNRAFPDKSRIDAGSISKEYLMNADHFSSHFSYYFREPLLRSVGDYAEVASFLRALKEGRIDLVTLLETGTSRHLSATDVLDAAGFDGDLSGMALVRAMDWQANEFRGDVFLEALRRSDVSPTIDEFQLPFGNGRNFIFDLGSAGPQLIVTSHYDRVPEGGGSHDAASCLAAILKAYDDLRSREALENIMVRFIAFDMEEDNRLGSRRYVENHTDLTATLAVLAVDQCGRGEAVGLWDVLPEDQESLVMTALRTAAGTAKVPLRTTTSFPGFYSDHVSFGEAGRMPAFAMTPFPIEDEERLRRFQANGANLAGTARADLPEIFQFRHDQSDNADTVEATAIDVTARVLAGAIRVLDRLVGQQ